jgi:hypothetical protein
MQVWWPLDAAWYQCKVVATHEGEAEGEAAADGEAPRPLTQVLYLEIMFDIVSRRG